VQLALLFFGLLRLVGYGSEPLLAGRDIHQAVGEPTRVGVGLLRPDNLRVVSWNIARGTQFDQVRDVLAGLDADVYILQEVDWACRRSGDRSIASDLADALNLNWVFAGEFQEIGEGRPGRFALTGQAILSRYPIDEISVLRFERQAALRWNLDPFQPRRGGRIALRARSGGVVIYNAHIESARDDRFRARQVSEILADHVRKPDSAAPLILAGDLNTGSARRSPVVESIIGAGLTDALGEYSESRKTSVRHPQPLDWIFVKSLEAREGRVSDNGKASDHFPLWATLTIPSLRAAVAR
jgi:endonuclease/exonuclease/phosphatase family metal-dependent hydrolase